MIILDKYKTKSVITDRKGVEHSILPQETEKNVIEVYTELLDYMEKNNVEKSASLSDAEKDNLLKEAHKIWNKGASKSGGVINTSTYNLLLYREEYKYLTDLLLNKLEYNVDTLFTVMEIKDKLKSMMDIAEGFKDNDTLLSFEFTPIELRYLVTVLNTKTVKGLTKESYLLYNIFVSIGALTRVYDTLKIEFDNLSKTVLEWAASLGYEEEKVAE